MAIRVHYGDKIIGQWPSSVEPFSPQTNEIDALVKQKADAMRLRLEAVFGPLKALPVKSQ